MSGFTSPMPTPSPGYRPPEWWPVTQGQLRAWAEMFWAHLRVQTEQIALMGEMIVNVSEYAQAVSDETDRIADALEELKNELAADEANDQAALDAAFGPVLDRLRGVGKEGPTAPPADEEPTPEPEQPADPGTDEL